MIDIEADLLSSGALKRMQDAGIGSTKATVLSLLQKQQTHPP